MHEHDQNCPRCGFGLVPVYAVEARERRVIYYRCPGPYCDYVERPAEARGLASSTTRPRRSGNSASGAA